MFLIGFATGVATTGAVAIACWVHVIVRRDRDLRWQVNTLWKLTREHDERLRLQWNRSP